MKIKNGYKIKQAAGSYLVMNLGGENDFSSMISLNETGAVIWRAIEEGLKADEIAERILEEYETDKETALRDINNFITKMKDAGVLED